MRLVVVQGVLWESAGPGEDVVGQSDGSGLD